MNTEHIVITQLPTVPKSTLYYYQGNFFHPVELQGIVVGIAKGAIRKFIKDNKEMIANDRAHPDYKTLVDLFDEQYPEIKTEV